MDLASERGPLLKARFLGRKSIFKENDNLMKIKGKAKILICTFNLNIQNFKLKKANLLVFFEFISAI